MSQQFRQLFETEILKSIDYFTLIQACRTSRDYLNICQNRNTWIYFIKRDLKSVLWARKISNEFLEEKVYSIYGGIDPKEFYEFYYIIYVLLHNHQLKDRLIIDKLRQLSLEGHSDYTFAIFYNWNIEKRSDVVIEGHLEGNNMYDILLQYILKEFKRVLFTGTYAVNPLSQIITDEVIFGELANKEIHTFRDLFNYLLIYFPIRDITNYIPVNEAEA